MFTQFDFIFFPVDIKQIVNYMVNTFNYFEELVLLKKKEKKSNNFVAAWWFILVFPYFSQLFQSSVVTHQHLTERS